MLNISETKDLGSLQESAHGESIGDVIHRGITWLWRHTHDVTIFKVIAFGNYQDPGQPSARPFEADRVVEHFF